MARDHDGRVALALLGAILLVPALARAQAAVPERAAVAPASARTAHEASIRHDDVADRNWNRRGGSALGLEIRGLLSGTVVPRAATNGGAGGGVGVRIGYHRLSRPRSGPVMPWWYGLRAGTGADVNVLYQATAGTGSVAGMALLNVQIPFFIGAEIGLGASGEDRWRGTTLGLSYVPILVVACALHAIEAGIPGRGVGAVGTYFNPAGVELTVDFTSVDARRHRLLREPHFRVALTLLPPALGRPLLGSLGFGAAWY